MCLQVINDALETLTPAIAIWGIGLMLLFQSITLCKEPSTKKLGITALIFGFFWIVIGLLAALPESLSLCCGLLILIISSAIIALLVWLFFVRKEP